MATRRMWLRLRSRWARTSVTCRRLVGAIRPRACPERSMGKRVNPAAKYTDDPEMQKTLSGESDNEAGATPMNKTERDYFNGTGRRDSALAAIQKARKANK